MTNGETKNLAERIALLLQEERSGDHFAVLRAGMEKINARLDKIESQIALQNSNPKSQMTNLKSIHSSQERFTNLDELADEIIKNLQNEKACPYEPTAKPCDHCSMCSSRGF